MRTIHKVKIQPNGENSVLLPLGARIISAGFDPVGTLCAWAEVEDSNKVIPKTIFVYGTGQHLSSNANHFVATVKDGQFMWHVYEFRQP